MACGDPQQHLSQREHKKGITVDRRTKGHGAFVPPTSSSFPKILTGRCAAACGCWVCAGVNVDSAGDDCIVKCDTSNKGGACFDGAGVVVVL